MPNVLHCIHRCGHLYGEGGVGERNLDLAPIIGDKIALSRDLPGFIDRRPDEICGGVTYESHHFWVHFTSAERGGDAYIVVHHGGGWEVWRGDYMLANALRGFGSDDRALFLMCWYLIDTTHYARREGGDEKWREVRQAFAEGRLKKRKLPNSNLCKVWIERGGADAAAMVAA